MHTKHTFASHTEVAGLLFILKEVSKRAHLKFTS
jgi:hypothetical protein